MLILISAPEQCLYSLGNRVYVSRTRHLHYAITSDTFIIKEFDGTLFFAYRGRNLVVLLYPLKTTKLGQTWLQHNTLVSSVVKTLALLFQSLSPLFRSFNYGITGFQTFGVVCSWATSPGSSLYLGASAGGNPPRPFPLGSAIYVEPIKLRAWKAF